MPIVMFTAKQVAKDLWEFGEDEHIERALKLTNKELAVLHIRTGQNLNKNSLTILGKYKAESYDLGLLSAATVVEYFEGNFRALSLKRRRNGNLLPAKLHYSAKSELGKQIKLLP